MVAFLPLHDNYHLRYAENEINNLVKDQDEPMFAEYDVQITRSCIIIAFACSTLVLWLKCLLLV